MTKATPSSHSHVQRVVLIGAGGLIGRAVLELLEARRGRYDVVGVSRTSRPALNLEDRSSIEACLAQLAPFDHVVVAAGEARFATLETLDDASFSLGLASKLMGQVNATLAALPHLSPGGSVTLTSGALSHAPVSGSAPAALVNGALDSFVRAVAFELSDGRRVNVVSPGWVTDTLVRFGMHLDEGVSASEVGGLYVRAIESDSHGQVITR